MKKKVPGGQRKTENRHIHRDNRERELKDNIQAVRIEKERGKIIHKQ